ncbi:MAG: MmgE/PrpD family protein [Firmicutes bacterium]|nr:MmgE/PrpD family protein [Bacillota bacterium]
MTREELALEPLVNWATHVVPADIPGQVYNHATIVIMDLLAVIWAGREEPEVKGLAKWVTDHRHDAEPWWRGVILGTAAVALELDEGNRRAMGHPGSHILPAMLSVLPELPSVTWEEVLFAFVVAYETSARIASGGTLRPGSHPHGTWGTIGGAVAIALLRGERSGLADTVRLASSVGLATAFSAPQEGRTVRNLYAGISAMMAYFANEWSGTISGIFAPSDTLFTMWSDKGLMDGIGTDYAVTQNYMKIIAACRYVHGAVEAIERLSSMNQLQESTIKSVDVETYVPAALLGGVPHNTLSSKFSLPYAILCGLRGRGHDFAAFHQPLHLSSQDYDFMNSVRVLPSASLTALLPGVRRTRVTIYLRDGVEPLTLEVDLPLGEWDHPLPDGALETKWSMLLSDYPKTIDLSILSLPVLREFVKNFLQSCYAEL